MTRLPAPSDDPGGGRALTRRLRRALPIALAVGLAAGVPLVLGLGSVGVALGLTAAASQGIISVDPNAQSLVLLIGLAVGVDYALFVIRRAREERAAGADVRDSIALAGATAGRAVANRRGRSLGLGRTRGSGPRRATSPSATRSTAWWSCPTAAWSSCR